MLYIKIPFAFLILLVVTTLCYGQTPDTTFYIRGTITNYKADKTIYIAMYANADDFKHQKGYKKLRFTGNQLEPDSLPYTFNEVKPGEYIIAVFQDCNGDGKINMGPFGPVEPYRIYKPNYGLFGPKFDKCKFTVNGSIDTAHIALK